MSLHIKANICAKFHENLSKTEEVVCDARFPPNYLPWYAVTIAHTFCHCPKICLAHLHPNANICAKFHENWSKTEEVVRDARFPPIFPHNMPLPWQRTFCHCPKMCLAHLHPKANICAKICAKTWNCLRFLNFYICCQCCTKLYVCCLLAKCYTFTGDRILSDFYVCWGSIITFAGVLRLLALQPPASPHLRPCMVLFLFSDSFQT